MILSCFLCMDFKLKMFILWEILQKMSKPNGSAY